MCATTIFVIVLGPTLSGKSEFILQMIKHREEIFTECFDRILLSYPLESGADSKSIQDYIKRMTEFYPRLEVIQVNTDNFARVAKILQKRQYGYFCFRVSQMFTSIAFSIQLKESC